MITLPQDAQLIKNLFELLEAHRSIIGQQRTYLRVVSLVMAEMFAFSRHVITQLLMTLGLTEQDWSAWYRLFSQGRFDAQRASEVLFVETLRHVGEGEVYVVAGDGTQTARSSDTMEGVSWLRNPRNPPFRISIHHAQRWFNGSWLMPAENGYSRAMPLRWLPAFTEKSFRKLHEACKEWQAAVQYLQWLRSQLSCHGRAHQQILLLGDGSYDTVALWKALPERVTLLTRSAKNRALRHLLPPGAHGNRKYGERAPTPQAFWQRRSGWKRTRLILRGHERDLQYRVEGPFLRQGAPSVPLFLLIIRGQKYTKHGQLKHREPVPYLVNAIRREAGDWVLPLPIQTLIFWAWQRWEIEVCHRELKSNFGLGDKQCFNPRSAVVSVQWSAWVYALLLLAGYRAWGLCGGPDVPTRWWRGSGRWSLNTLWRAYRAALWGSHDFRAIWAVTTGNWDEKEARLIALRNAAFASARS
jgi:hypothetical protein